jgi:hypothetical protein
MVARCFVVWGVLLAALPALAGPKVLVVPASRWDTALRSSCEQVPGVTLADTQATLGLVDDARSVGLSCPINDAACWLRIAVLGGYDQALLLVDDRLILISPTVTKTTEVERRESQAFIGAVRRLFELEGAVRVVVNPDQGAVRSLDGVPVGAGIVDGVTPGPHHVVVDAPGYARAEADVVVDAGAIAEVTIELAAVPPAAPTSLALGPTVWWTGVGALVLGGAGAAALIIAGEGRYAADGCGADNNTGSVCGQGGTATKAAQPLTWSGLGVGAAAAIVGGAALVTGAVLTE